VDVPSETRDDASDITVAVLTGRRPRLLRQTLEALPQWLCKTARMVVFHNGGDPDTAYVLNEFVWDVRVTRRDDEMLSVGPAFSELMTYVVTAKTELVLYLEDDWLFNGDPEDRLWLEAAVAALQLPGIGLVRLRNASERTLNRNMITQEPIVWKRIRGQGFTVAEHAHYTFNPTLMRIADVPWWAASETHAQRLFEGFSVRKKSAQLMPGVFSHIGGGQSLRKITEAGKRPK
jgi:hypothetical protein